MYIICWSEKSIETLFITMNAYKNDSLFHWMRHLNLVSEHSNMARLKHILKHHIATRACFFLRCHFYNTNLTICQGHCCTLEGIVNHFRIIHLLWWFWMHITCKQLIPLTDDINRKSVVVSVILWLVKSTIQASSLSP